MLEVCRGLTASDRAPRCLCPRDVTSVGLWVCLWPQTGVLAGRALGCAPMRSEGISQLRVRRCPQFWVARDPDSLIRLILAQNRVCGLCVFIESRFFSFPPVTRRGKSLNFLPKPAALDCGEKFLIPHLEERDKKCVVTQFLSRLSV